MSKSPSGRKRATQALFPDRQERNAAGPASSRNRAAEGRAQEPSRQEAGHPGTFPDRQERNTAGPGDRETEPQRVEERGVPASFRPRREDRRPSSEQIAHPRLPPLAGAGPARRHRLGRLARSRAATRGLGLRGLAARVFGPPGEPPSEALASECGHFVGSRLELHDGDEPNCPLRVEDRVDAFNNLEDL